MSLELKLALTVVVWVVTLWAWRRFHRFVDSLERKGVRRGKR